MMILLSPNLSFSCCLDLLSRTRIPWFNPVSAFHKLSKNPGAYIDLLQIQLAPLGHHQKKTSQNFPVHMDISLVT